MDGEVDWDNRRFCYLKDPHVGADASNKKYVDKIKAMPSKFKNFTREFEEFEEFMSDKEKRVVISSSESLENIRTNFKIIKKNWKKIVANNSDMPKREVETVATTNSKKWKRL